MLGVLLLNPLETVVWNSNKLYLKELALKGVPVIETLWIDQQELPNLKHLMNAKGWSNCVLKPVVSSGGMHTKRFNIDEANSVSEEFYLLDVNLWMLQQFAKEIIDDGERSFIFIEKQFSHCVLKKPAKGNFLVNEFHGGSQLRENPPAWMTEQAAKILEATGKEALFARVDTVCRNGILHVMEVEKVEPRLYTEYTEGFAERFATAFLHRLEKNM